MSDSLSIITYDEEDLVDIPEEIDLSDIFNDESGIGESEILGIFDDRKTAVYPRGTGSSEKTIVADRKSFKELEEEEGQAQEKSPEDEELRTELKDIKRKKKKHRHSYFFIEVFFLLAAAAALTALAMSPIFTIRNIRVDGNRFYTDRQIINMSEAKTGGNLFRDAQKSKIKNNLKDNIYFRSVSVRRSIPDTLVIEVNEKQELAALTYGDKYVVIDDHEEVLRVAKIDPEVTVVTGFTISKMDEGSKLEVEEKKAFKDTLATLYSMRDGDFYFKRIQFTGDGSKVSAYIYDMMKVDGTSDQLRDAIESGTLQKVVNKLMKNKIRRGTIILGDNNYISFSPAV